MGLLGGILKIAGLLILALVGLGAFLYFTDYAAEATIVEKGRDGGGDYVVIQPNLVPYKVTKHLDGNTAQFVCEGYGVTYRLQSGHYAVRDEQGRLVYDSDAGLNNAISPLRCNLLG